VGNKVLFFNNGIILIYTKMLDKDF